MHCLSNLVNQPICLYQALIKTNTFCVQLVRLVWICVDSWVCASACGLFVQAVQFISVRSLCMEFVHRWLVRRLFVSVCGYAVARFVSILKNNIIML